MSAFLFVKDERLSYQRLISVSWNVLGFGGCGSSLNAKTQGGDVRGVRSWRTFRNTYLMGPKRLFTAIVDDDDYLEVLKTPAVDQTQMVGKANSVCNRISRRLRPWFWPQIADAAIWVSASESGSYSPSTYLIEEPGPLLIQLMQRTSIDASIVDLGCNSGANLNFLYQSGYRRLAGVDAGREALELFAHTFPEAFACARPANDLFQHYLLTRDTDTFDVLHSNGATIELVHPSFPIVAEICRVTRDSVYLDICERGHAYPRRYVEQFARYGFVLVHGERASDPVHHSSILVFRNQSKSR